METQVGSKISWLLNMMGDRRLEVEDGITKSILSIDPEQYPGIRVKFVESKKIKGDEGNWIEYNVLFEVLKYKDTPEYLGHTFKEFGKIIKSLSHVGIDSIGVNEVDCGYSDFYYILVYILSDGGEKTNKEEEDCFISGGAEEL